MEQLQAHATFEKNKITVKEVGFPKRIYEIVNNIPENYQVWNIGHHMVRGYLPLCIAKNYNVDTNRLKAIKVSEEEWHIVMKAIGYSPKIRILRKKYKKTGNNLYLQAAIIIERLSNNK